MWLMIDVDVVNAVNVENYDDGDDKLQKQKI